MEVKCKKCIFNRVIAEEHVCLNPENGDYNKQDLFERLFKIPNADYGCNKGAEKWEDKGYSM